MPGRSSHLFAECSVAHCSACRNILRRDGTGEREIALPVRRFSSSHAVGLRRVSIGKALVQRVCAMPCVVNANIVAALDIHGSIASAPLRPDILAVPERDLQVAVDDAFDAHVIGFNERWNRKS